MSQLSEFVDRHYAAVNRGDVDTAAAEMADGIDNQFPGVGRVPGKDGFKMFAAPFFRAFPDAAIRVVSQAESGDMIITEGVYTGTHTGPLMSPQGEVPPTGKSIELHFCDVFQVKDAVAVGHRLYFDNMEFMGQLGLLPAGNA